MGQDALRETNTYVQDFVSAGELLQREEVTNAQFVIEPNARPKDAHKRTYNTTTFNEVSVLMVEAKGGAVPKRSVKVRKRDGGVWDIDETNRAFDPLHFVLLFPHGDDGWHPHIEKATPDIDSEGPARKREQSRRRAQRSAGR